MAAQQSAAEKMASFDPATLRAQAKHLRETDPETIRRSNPGMANFSDEQILEASNQMEEMAGNPELQKQAAEELVRTPLVN
jgi:hypothetical protein